MKVPLLDLGLQYKEVGKEIEVEVLEVLRSQRYILGPKVESLEMKIAEYTQTQYAIGVSSGSDALIIALMAAGIGKGDEVITTPFTFFATAGAIARVGAKPIFVDIEKDSFNIDPSKIEPNINSNTKAIIPVHLYGRTARMNDIIELADKHGLIVIEDGAQAIGSEYKGKRAGSFGDYGCFSFFPSKNLGAAGDGGIVVTQSKKNADKLKTLRAHGSSPKYYHSMIGGNFRLDPIQAAIVEVKLKYLDQWSHKRKENAGVYRELIKDSKLNESAFIQLPDEGCSRHVYNQFNIRCQQRDELKDFLQKEGIGTEIYYPLSMHMQQCFSNLNLKEGDYPESELAAKESLALPIFPELTNEQLKYVVLKLEEFYFD